jgi:N-acetylmuramoyl-L-alanine amidase
MVIAIDAGHGGEDDGAVSGTTGVAEKDLNLDLSLRVAKILERDGHRVVLTRKNDRKIPLEERTRIANRARADVFIAIHFNSSPKSSARGIETFTLTPQGQPSTYATAGNTVRKFPANDLDGLNTVLGYCLQSSLVSMVSATDRGVKHSHFTVLRGLRCPGALLECGFLSNAAESTVVTSSEYREKLARAIVAGIMQFAASTAR